MHQPPPTIMLRRSLTTLSLVFVMFFNTSGGPFTLEGLVAQIGPGVALLILLLIPLLWSLPETLIVAELSSMLPVEGGYYRWVQRAFGRFWAFQNGWITWMYSLVDMAIYPVLFNAYLGFFFPDLTTFEQWTVSLLVIWGATAINLRGALPVGWISVIAGTFILGAFATLSLLALPKMSHAPWEPFLRPSGEMDGSVASAMAVGLSTALWNYIGWDNASTVGGEIRDSARTYPRALFFSLTLVTLGYFIPLLTTLSATDWTLWRDGGWPDIARLVAGPTIGSLLGTWIAVAGMVSALALFNALLLVYSRIPLVLAEDGFLPPAIAKTDARGTPRNAVLFSAIFYSVFALVHFGSLVIADVILYSLALSLEFGALIRLRRTEPNLRGPFRLPVGRGGVIVLALLPLAILVAVVVLSFMDGEYGLPAVIGAVVALALGPVLFWIGRWRWGASGVVQRAAELSS